jgi:hypothetical protein
LLVLQMIDRIRRIFELELPVRSVFDEPTIAGLAIELQKAQELGLKARVPIMQRRADSAVHRCQPRNSFVSAQHVIGR